MLVADNLMPELTGLELIRALVSSTSAAERPEILMMTAHATIESARAAAGRMSLQARRPPSAHQEDTPARGAAHHRARRHTITTPRARKRHGIPLT